MMAYKTRPRLTQAERNEMQMDLLQAYHYQLMNDQELYQFKSYRSIFSVLNMYLAGAIPMSLAYTLRPGAFEHLLNKKAIVCLPAFSYKNGNKCVLKFDRART